jgi:acetoacetyl-CoA synthetase
MGGVSTRAASPFGELQWKPDEAWIDASRMTEFKRWLETERGLRLDDYAALWQWSITETETFWRAIWDFFEVRADGDPTTVLESSAMPGAVWFPRTRLNYAEHVFAGKADEDLAIVHASELRGPERVSWGELRAKVGGFAAGLRALGVGPGDRVVAYLPNLLEATVAFLATASIGAVWSSTSPDFGAKGAIDRFAQIEPKVLLAVDGYSYGGKRFDRTDAIREMREAMPSLVRTVVLPYLDPEYRPRDPGTVGWSELEATEAELRFERVDFSAPLWILFSSGTTGLPKAIVQGHGGILLEHLKELNLHVDARAGDRLFWFTTTGWMMWNFLVSGLLTPAVIVLFDGNPGHPDVGALWDLAAATGITIFGTSAAYIAACMKAGVEPGRDRDLSALRSVGATGSPLSPESFDWVYEQLDPRIWLFSMSGGTDLCTAFVGGVPTLPVYRGELQARALGAPVEAWDDGGHPVVDEVGELVITGPMPSMPLRFWGDESGERYRESYFDLFPGVWRHGDWIEITSRGTAVISGRSDSTINRGGIRIGTAEIYRAALAEPEVADAIAVDLPKQGTDGWITLFVVLADGADTVDPELRQRLVRSIRERCSPRHVPDEIEAIPEVPRTLSGKALEVPVKRILMGGDPVTVVSKSSLANPQALEHFVGRAQRQGH